MPLTVDLSALIAVRQRITSNVPTIDFGRAQPAPLEPIDVTLGGDGIEVTDFNELDQIAGLLSYQGRQILLYIPDHRSRAGDVLDGNADGNKFHVSDCAKLQQMRASNQFDRYQVTNRTDTRFFIRGTRGFQGPAVEGDATLKICRHCLRKLNYRGYVSGDSDKQLKIVAEFVLLTFFAHYSTVFRFLPRALSDEQHAGYSDDWPHISRRVREQASYNCDQCGVGLRDSPYLLHVHHINGVRGDNRPDNLRPLCADCHRKQPKHGHMRPPSHGDMQRITSLRRKQDLLANDSWRDIWVIADTAVAGVLDRVRKARIEPPEIGFEVTDARQAVCGEFEAAWPRRRVGLYIAEPPKEVRAGWRIFSLQEATENWEVMARALG